MQRIILSLFVMILMIIVSGCGDDNNAQNSSTEIYDPNDDTLHITAEEFKDRYNKNLAVVYAKDKEWYNKLKINGIEKKTLDDNSISYEFDTDTLFSTLAFSDNDNDKIHFLNIGIMNDNTDHISTYITVMSIAIYSLSNKNTISKPDELKQIKDMVGNLIVQVADIHSSGKPDADVKTHYKGNEIVFIDIIGKGEIIQALVIKNEKYNANESSEDNSKYGQNNQEPKRETPKTNQNKQPSTTGNLKDNQNKTNPPKKVDTVQSKEILVGNSNVTGRDCYLLTDSIRVDNDHDVSCRIKMVKAGSDVQYLEYKFYGRGLMQFRTNEGFTGKVDAQETPIEYNTIMNIKKLNNE